MPAPTHRNPHRAVWALALALIVTACGSSAGDGGASRRARDVIQVVAAENFWGSIVSQIGGSHVHVTSIINSPAADPHDYEPTPADARAVATADLVVVNGVGYDGWADKLLAASPGDRTVLDIGHLVGAKDGDNPHRWYSPPDVQRFTSNVTAELDKLAPSLAAGFDRGRQAFETGGLASYDAQIADIKRRYAGVPVGASESIFSLLSPALGLDLLTPPTFLKAISEGTDVSAADKTTIDRQIETKAIKVYVYNSQNATPDIQAQVKACRDRGIPTVTITETLTPANATFQEWQTRQLARIRDALARGTGR